MSAVPDPVAVLAEIGWTADAPPTQINSGWDNHLWRFQRGGSTYGLRLVRKAKYPGPEAMVLSADAELAAMEVAQEGALPVPEVMARGTWCGAPFIVMEWLPGAPLVDAAKRRPWHARRLGREFGRLQARLHTLPGDRLRPITDTDWVERAEHPGLIATIREQLTSANPRFCHFDFHPLNVLHDGTQITGLIDFTNASASDPRVDLGMTNALLVAAPLPAGVAGRATNTVRRHFLAGWRDGYLDFSGHFPLEPVFEALGYAIYCHEFARAIDEGRGWATERDLKKLRALRDEKIRQAGL